MLSVHLSMRPALRLALLVASLIAGGEAEPLAAAESHTRAPLELAETRNPTGMPAATLRGAAARRRPLFAALELYAAASASPKGITFTGHLELVKLTPRCESAAIDFSASHVIQAPPTMGEEPAVAVIHDQVCVEVLAENPPVELVGMRIPVTRVTLQEFLNGEEYSSADPDDLQAAGASVYVPDARFGHQVGVFIVAGYLELPDGSVHQSNAVVASAVISGGQGLLDQRLFATLRSPARTPVSLMMLAPTFGTSLRE
jgi:hypothetical protein